MDATLKQQHGAEPSILGAAPPLVGSPRPVFPNVFINNEVAGRKKMSRWDMKTQGTTHFLHLDQLLGNDMSMQEEGNQCQSA
jgi:hypothetical protein